MISSAVSLNMGIEDAVKSQYPYDVNVGFYGYSYEEAEEAQKFMRSEAEKSGIPVKSVESEISLSAVGFSTGKAAPRPVRLLVCSGSHWLHPAVHWLRRAEHPAGTALLGGGRHGGDAGPVLPLEGQAAVCGGTAAPLAGKARHECSEYFLQPVRTERVRAGAGRASGTLGLSA